jgi:hypothetical protein
VNRTAVAAIAVGVAMLAGAVLAPPLPDPYDQTVDPEYAPEGAVGAETPVAYAELTAREQRAFRAALSGEGRPVLYASDPPPHLHGGDSPASRLTVVRYQGTEYVVSTRGPGLAFDDLAVGAGLATGGLLAVLSGVTALLSGHASRRLGLVAASGGLALLSYAGALLLPSVVPWPAVAVPSLLTALVVPVELSDRSWPGLADGTAADPE